jgi:2-oxoglutarate/2-oxoacid ferredoxin oxidoreductase subunit beta
MHNSLLNKDRPTVFCPGCSHELSIKAIDKAFRRMGFKNHEVAIISDIGCSGLVDTYFKTHALHGLHGRALTYATGLKMAQPQLNVVVTMGDGGIGIGGAHLLAACRRNLDITLVVCNNFNFGMTGGQASVSTPMEAEVSSGFLNKLEKTMDICKVAAAAGAPYVVRSSAYDQSLDKKIEAAIRYEGFSLIDIHGICTGRYSAKNRLTPEMIKKTMVNLVPADGLVPDNIRNEYGQHYRQLAAKQVKSSFPKQILNEFEPLLDTQKQILLLGSAGQRVITAGEVLCLAAMTGGLHVTQKNDYHITVSKGPSISELILSPLPIRFTGIVKASVIILLDEHGLKGGMRFFSKIDDECILISVKGLQLPEQVTLGGKSVIEIDFKKHGIKFQDRALGSLSALTHPEHAIISSKMLSKALTYRFKGQMLTEAMNIIGRMEKS